MTKSESTTMLCESGGVGVGEDPALLSLQELELICDLFYLPCEHGQKVGANLTLEHSIGQLDLHCLVVPEMTVLTPRPLTCSQSSTG